MAIVLKSIQYQDITIDKNIIIGVMGDNYLTFLKAIQGKEVFNFINVSFNGKNQVLDYLSNSFSSEYLEDLHLSEDFMKKKVSDLSHSEIKLLKYLMMLSCTSSIIIIDEPFQDLDYHYKKIIIALFNRLIRYKTIIIGSRDSDIIYEICKMVLLLGKNSYIYQEPEILANKRILKKYHVMMPQIIRFIREANDKGNHLPYKKDIRDLIKDVYKNVTK